MTVVTKGTGGQEQRNRDLIAQSVYMRSEVTSKALPFHIDIRTAGALDAGQVATLQAIEIQAARIAIQAVGEIAKVQRHRSPRRRARADPGPADDARRHRLRQASQFTIEHGHTASATTRRWPRSAFCRRARRRQVPPQPRHRRPRLVGARRHAARLRAGSASWCRWPPDWRSASSAHTAMDAFVDLPQRRRRLDFRPGAERLQRRRACTARRSRS